MPSLAVTNTLVSGSTITAAQHNTNYNDIVSYINARDAGSTPWSAVAVSGTVTNTSASGNSLIWDTSTLIVDATNHRTGIGLTAPLSTLSVCDSSGGNTVGDAQHVVSAFGQNVAQTGSSAILQVHSNDAVAADKGGSVGFGTRVTTSSTDGAVIAQIAGRKSNSSSGDYGGYLAFSTRRSSDSTMIERLRIDQAGNVGVGTAAPGQALDIRGGIVASRNGAVPTQTVVNALIIGGNTTGGLIQSQGPDASTIGTMTFILAKSDGSASIIPLIIGATGGAVFGAATGSDKGIGTGNFAGDVYKNNTAYTNPDYALEHYFNGSIVKFSQNEGASDYAGLMPLDSLKDYMSQSFDLPGVKSRFKDESGAQGAFARADIALEKIEEAHLYIVQLHERVKELEKKGS